MKLTQETVRELLEYNPEDGFFTWKPRGPEWFKLYRTYLMWNTRFAGNRAGCEYSREVDGYRRTGIKMPDGKRYSAHRLAWIYMTGRWPSLQIDHINRDASDNRWANLREVPNFENDKNRSLQSNNRSGFTGVRWHSVANKWNARIYVNRKEINLGLYENLSDAVAARSRAEIEHGFHEGHGKPRPY